MKSIKTHNFVVAIKERSAGNETVGTCWLETKTFSKDSQISDIMEWAENSNGKVMITVDESSYNGKSEF